MDATDLAVLVLGGAGAYYVLSNGGKADTKQQTPLGLGGAAPSLDLSGLKFPSFKMPEINIPDVSQPQFPDYTKPDIPKFTKPDFTKPDFTLPDFTPGIFPPDTKPPSKDKNKGGGFKLQNLAGTGTLGDIVATIGESGKALGNTVSDIGGFVGENPIATLGTVGGLAAAPFTAGASIPIGMAAAGGVGEIGTDIATGQYGNVFGGKKKKKNKNKVSNGGTAPNIINEVTGTKTFAERQLTPSKAEKSLAEQSGLSTGDIKNIAKNVVSGSKDKDKDKDKQTTGVNIWEHPGKEATGGVGSIPYHKREDLM